MARIVDPSAQERPIPRPASGFARLREPAPQDGVARGLMQAGAAVEAGSEEIYRAVKVEEERVNVLRAEEAYNQAIAKKHELTYGEKDGFVNLKGAAAVTRPVLQEWGKRLQDVETEIAGTLSNDQQRELFKRRMGVARLQYTEDIYRHLAREGDTYAKEVFDGTITTARREAVARWDSANDIAMQLDRVKKAIEERAERYQWAPEYREAQLKEKQGLIHSDVVRQALANNNFVYAQEYAKAHKGDMDAVTQAAVLKAVEDGTQKQLTNSYNAEYLTVESQPKALEALRQRVLKDESLNEDRRNILVGRIQNRQMVLERRAEIAEAKRERLVAGALNELNSSTLAGFEPKPEAFTQVLAAAKGTPLEGQVRQAIGLANATREFRNQPPAVQERLLAEAEAGVRKDPSKFDRRVIGAWREIYDAQQRQVKDDPVTFAVRQGIVEPPAPLDLSAPEKAGAGLQERFAIARGVAQKYNAPFKPLTEQETNLLRTVMTGATADQKRNYFSGLAQAAGSDYAGFSAVMGQIAPDDPVTAVAGTYAFRGRTSASDLMLRGQQLLNPPKKADGKPDQGKLWPMPPEAELRKGFQSYEKDAFAGHAAARNAMYQAALAIYAAKSSDEGDASGVINSGRWEEAMRLATGGIEKYKGKAVVLPYGYEYSQFRDELGKRIQTISESGRLAKGVTIDKVSDLPLEAVGDGRYVFKAGDGVLVDKDGQPVVVDFNVSTPFRTSGDGQQRAVETPTAEELEQAKAPVTGRAATRRKAQ